MFLDWKYALRQRFLFESRLLIEASSQKLVHCFQHNKENISVWFAEKEQLRKQNIRLFQQNLALRVQLVRLGFLKKENAMLKGLAQSMPEDITYKVAFLEVPWGKGTGKRFAWIDKGEQEDIRSGQIILGSQGVIGTVMTVYSHKSVVLLVTDKSFAISVQSRRNGTEAVLHGLGGKLVLEGIYFKKFSIVQAGDIFVTSQSVGLGYPIARVVCVNHSAEVQFPKVILEPAADLHAQYVAIIMSRTLRTQLKRAGV